MEWEGLEASHQVDFHFLDPIPEQSIYVGLNLISELRNLKCELNGMNNED